MTETESRKEIHTADNATITVRLADTELTELELQHGFFKVACAMNPSQARRLATALDYISQISEKKSDGSKS